MGILSLFNAILAIVGVLFLAYWCSRMLGKQWGMNTCSGNMKVLSQLQVGQDKRILLLNIGAHNYLVGVSQAGIQLLTEVEGEFETDMPQNMEGIKMPSFQELLEKYKELRHDKNGVDR
ncbi:MAG: flagellar biosynthetic protein FliO [Lachnospiraceae bacterium]|jgi:Flagellar biogenesis protein|nr:flagellar biosynthetic protein FliO [Lachnospiraceae bacterium]MCI9657890.1 flagellar biosynthetic protein FliO [Lachnospiraceae bacterium]